MQNLGPHLDQQNQKVRLPEAPGHPLPPILLLGSVLPLHALHSLFPSQRPVLQTFCLMKAAHPTPLARAPLLPPFLLHDSCLFSPMAVPRPHGYRLLLVAARHQFPSPFPSLWTSWDSAPTCRHLNCGTPRWPWGWMSPWGIPGSLTCFTTAPSTFPGCRAFFYLSII